MSGIDFGILVNTLLSEGLADQLKPATGDSTLDSIGSVANFVSQLVFREGGYARQDTLITFKPVWPYADTFEYIRVALVRAGFLKNDRQSVKTLGQVIENQKPKTAQDLVNIFLQQTPNNQPQDTLIQDIDRKIQYLSTNKTNYRDYFNTTLKQLNDETTVIAAEPYLNLTPQESIVNVLQDFGGYDIKTAEMIIMYPGENKYTQMGDHIGGVVMNSVIDISKLILIFYREFIQTHAEEILDHIKYFLEETDRWFIFRNVNQATLSRLVTDIAGKKPQDIAQAATTAGKETAPSDAIAKYIHDDYIAFLNGMSGLVLENYDFTPAQNSEQTQNRGTQTPTQLNQQRVNTGRNAPRVAPPGSRRTSSSTDTFSSDVARMGDNLNLFDKFYNKVFINEQNQPQPIPLIKTINDFRIVPGTGQQVFQAYLHLFNNMRKGEIPSKWETRAQKTFDIVSGTTSALKDIFSGFKGF